MLRQNSLCIDILGHTFSGSVGLYPCHNTGGNQVRYYQNVYTLQVFLLFLNKLIG